MKRRIVVVLLAMGVVGGYGSGIAHVLHHHHAACAGWQQQHERAPGHEPG